MHDWTAIEALPQMPLNALFAGDAERVDRLSLTQSGILFDFSKTHLSAEALTAFEALAGQAGLTAKRDDLFAGRVVNPSEGRAAEHTAERGEGSPDSVSSISGDNKLLR